MPQWQQLWEPTCSSLATELTCMRPVCCGRTCCAHSREPGRPRRGRRAQPGTTPSTTWRSMPRFMTTSELAELCRTSENTVRYWRHIGAGPPSFKLGRRVLYDAEAVEEWLRRAQESDLGRR